MSPRPSQRACLPAAVLLGSALMFAPVAPAAAWSVGAAGETTERLMHSHDGRNFSPGNDVDLFAAAGRVVPGDSVTKQIWLRNDAGEVGDLGLHLVGVNANNLDLAQATALTLTGPHGRTLSRTTLAEALETGPCTAVSSDLMLHPGETLAVEAKLSINPELGSRPGDSGGEGTLANVEFQLRATLSDARAGGAEPKDCPPPGGQGSDEETPDGGDGPEGPEGGTAPSEGQHPGGGTGASVEMPTTGSASTIPALILSAVLLGAGLLTLLLARQRRQNRQHPQGHG
ncbi:hypothetical protein F7P69_29580 [Cellulosimicrobium funkei]|nr:hypothetical protein [Cellulosimicrobium funkei]